MNYRRHITLANLHIRDDHAEGSDNAPRIVGHAAVFDVEARIGSFFREVIKPGAFTRALKEKQDVRALLNHNVSPVLARTKSGTLSLREDELGLAVEFALPRSQGAILESVERGDLDQMSFSFIPRTETWIDPGEDSNELPLAEVRDVDLFDVSLVTFPAYDSTDAEVARLRGAEAACREYHERRRANLDQIAANQIQRDQRLRDLRLTQLS